MQNHRKDFRASRGADCTANDDRRLPPPCPEARGCWWLLLLLIGAAWTNRETFAEDGRPAALVTRRSSIVAIAAFSPSDHTPFPADPFQTALAPEPGTPLPIRWGTGAIIRYEPASRTASILTTAHLTTIPHQTAEAASIPLWIKASNGVVLPAKVWAADPLSDLAVVQATFPEGTAAPSVLPLGESENVEAGETLFLFGNPWTIARDGMCSISPAQVNERTREDPSAPSSALGSEDPARGASSDLFVVTSSFDSRASGGALLDNKLRLVGLTTALQTLPGYRSNVTYALGISRPTHRLIGDLLSGYEVEYGFLGLQQVDTQPADLAGIQPQVPQRSAALVQRVAKGSPAEAAGVQAGDIVLKVNDAAVTSGDHLNQRVAMLGPGAHARLSVYRPSMMEVVELDAVLGKWPVYDDTQIVASRQRFAAWRGITVDYATARKRYLPDGLLTEFPQGVVVVAVAPGSPAQRAGLQAGERIRKVVGETINSPAEFHAAAGRSSGAVTLQTGDGTAVVIPSPK